jgi:hypothetical protein
MNSEGHVNILTAVDLREIQAFARSYYLQCQNYKEKTG